MEYNLDEKKLKLTCINFSDEIVKDEIFLKNKDVTVFNSSILQLENSDDMLISSRGWYGNIRSWDGVNFIILSLFDKDFKKKKQNIIGIDLKALQDKDINFKEFKEFKESQKNIIAHGDKLLKGPEDPRLFYLNNDIYILINDLTPEDKRHMFVAKVNLDTLNYGKTTELCESLSTKFEKNWGPFIYEDKLHFIYDINPLKIFELEDNFDCELKFNMDNSLLKKVTDSFPDLDFHLRNSTNLISLNQEEYLGLGHGVLDYKNNTDINKYLISLFDNSEYSESDKTYFKKFFKFYTGFFYKLNMKKQEITHITPFFQLPNYESKQELIFFPTSISMDSEKYISISYNVGDNRSYFTKLHLDVINISLYNKDNIDFLVNLNINPNYYIELIRTLRKYLGYSVKKKNYYIFGNTKKTFSLKKKINKKSKLKTKKSITKPSKKINHLLDNEKLPFGEMKGAKIKDLKPDFIKEFIKTNEYRKNKKLIDLFFKYHSNVIEQSGGGKKRNKRSVKKSSKKHTLHYFGTDWCFYCKKFNPKWKKLVESHKKNKHISFKKTVVDESNEDLVNKFNIVSYPTLLLVKDDGSQIPYLSDKREKKDIDVFLKQQNVF